MLRNEQLFRAINDKIHIQASKKEKIKSNAEKVNEKYDIPVGILTDYMTLRVPVDDASDFVLYALSTIYLSSAQINKYFTKKEIEFYNKSKFEKIKIKFQ